MNWALERMDDSDPGSAPPAPMVTESDLDDEAGHEHGPDDVDIA